MPEPSTAHSTEPIDHQVAQLTPDNVRVGGAGIFSGEWALTDDNRYEAGYVGILHGHWNGWAVFTCSRDVAAAIVADHIRIRTEHLQRLLAAGHTAAEAGTRLAAQLPHLWWDGDSIVHDERGIIDDPDSIHRYPPDTDGRYTVAGGIWTWEAVPPSDCDRIHGTSPARDHPAPRCDGRPVPAGPHDDVFVSDGLGLRCTVCGTVGNHDIVTNPSMAGDGTDTAITCRLCHSYETSDPIFGTHRHPAPWPPDTDTDPPPTHPEVPS
jgi:hypothetical protein